MSSEIGSLLGRWHQWRSHYSHERGYSRVRFEHTVNADDDEEAFERMQMRAIEDAVTSMSREHQLALQHLARAECLGVEVIFLNALPRDTAARDSLCAVALRELERRLIAAGVI